VEDRFAALEIEYVPTTEPERAVLVGIERLRGEGRRSMQELIDLTKAAGAIPKAIVVQRRDKPSPSTFVGKGKLEELRAKVLQVAADLVIFNSDLSPVQARNLANAIGREVRLLDRSELILDIFALHAHTKEGKLQVELAQLNYALPKLVGWGQAMSRIGSGVRAGGVGVRGPGETKLEVDRRRIRKRIALLRRRLEEVERRRSIERRNRDGSGIPTVGLVGYTNAGKSSLLNALAGRQVASAHDRLFETLDTIVRRVDLGEGREVLISDTVGFIHDLPAHLVAAFRATLKEVVEADLLVEVVDASDRYALREHEACETVLHDLGVTDKPRLVVLNKWDLVDGDAAKMLVRRQLKGALPISALTGYNLDVLRNVLQERLYGKLRTFTVQLPYTDLTLLGLCHEKGHVIWEDYKADVVEARVQVDDKLLSRLKPYVIAR